MIGREVEHIIKLILLIKGILSTVSFRVGPEMPNCGWGGGLEQFCFARLLKFVVHF
jgi:hypothetical protein